MPYGVGLKDLKDERPTFILSVFDFLFLVPRPVIIPALTWVENKE
jgi:hypothetical protein